MIPANLTSTWVNHLWQSTIVVGVAWLLALALRRNQARVRYWVWMAASVKFLLPFALLIGAGEWLRSLMAAPVVVQPALASVMDQITQPFPQAQSLDFAGPVVAAQRANLLPLVLLAIWACGALIVVARWTRGWLRIHAAMRAASPLTLAADVPVLSSSALLEPGIFGIFRPVLLLPEGILHRLTQSQLDAIIAHEMCHVRRRDNLTFAAHMIVEALFWFFPPAWWIGARLIEERERACDEAVLQAGGDAEVYAEGILNVCKMYVESPLECAAGVSGSDLKKRIVRIMAEQVARKLTLSRKVMLGVVGVLALAVPLALGLTNSAQQSAQSDDAGNLHKFEVASIRPDHSGSRLSRSGAAGLGGAPKDRFFVTNTTIKDLICWTFAGNSIPLPRDQVSGGPGWINSERYDIDAKLEDSQVAALAKLSPIDRIVQIRLMVQSLLADRFGLVVENTTATRPVYALVIAKGGSKLQETVPGSPSPIESGGRQIQARFFPGDIRGHGIPMSYLARSLSQLGGLGRPVLDETGLKGKYDIDLKWTPDNLNSPGMTPGPSPSAETAPPISSGPSIFTAIQEQLGLKLKATKSPVETLVIVHIEKPSEN